MCLHVTSGLPDHVSPIDGELYSATLNNFLGTEPVILRNMGPHHSMKTEYLAFWLNGEPGGTGVRTGGAMGGGPCKGPRTPSPANPSLFPVEPHFVGSAYIPESVGSFTGDDDKVYFFFSERAVEYDCYAEQVVARVARVCKVRSPAVASPGSPAGLAGLTGSVPLPSARATWGVHGPCRGSGPRS